jgi:hypothetical protein
MYKYIILVILDNRYCIQYLAIARREPTALIASRPLLNLDGMIALDGAIVTAPPNLNLSLLAQSHLGDVVQLYLSICVSASILK